MTYEAVPNIIKGRENVILADYIMCKTRKLQISDMTEKEKQAYKAFKDFHQFHNKRRPTRYSMMAL